MGSDRATVGAVLVVVISSDLGRLGAQLSSSGCPQRQGSQYGLMASWNARVPWANDTSAWYNDVEGFDIFPELARNYYQPSTDVANRYIRAIGTQFFSNRAKALWSTRNDTIH